MDQISGFLEIFVIYFVYYGYQIFRFALLRKNTDIQKTGYRENMQIFEDIYEYLRIYHFVLVKTNNLKNRDTFVLKIFLHDI